MTEDKLAQDEQLFVHLVSSFSSTAWIGLGKIKNPVSDKIERDLQQASFAIDMLDMLSRRMDKNLSNVEKRFLNSTIGDLKLNYVEEMKKSEEESVSSDKGENNVEENNSLETESTSGATNDSAHEKQETDENTKNK